MSEIQIKRKEVMRKSKTPYGLSGVEVMDLLVSIAEESERRFNVNMLYNPNFIHDAVNYSDGSYGKFISDTIEHLGIEAHLIPREYEPPFGIATKYEDNSKEFKINKKELEKILKNFTVLDKELFCKTEERDLLAVQYGIKFSWQSNSGYFIEECLKEMFEEMNVPKFAIPILSKLYSFKERVNGKKDLDEVSRQIQTLCKQVNPITISVLDYANHEGDLFSYKNHVFYFRRNNNKDNHLNLSHSVGYPNLHWAYVLYNKIKEKPIAYSIIRAKNKDINNVNILG